MRKTKLRLVIGSIYDKISMLKAVQTSKGSDKWMTASMCVVISVVLHVIIAVLITLKIITQQSEVTEVKNEKQIDKELVIDIKLEQLPAPEVAPLKQQAPMTPNELKDLAAKKEELPKEQPKPAEEGIKNVRTSDDQLSGVVPDTNLEGERDTIAASNAAAIAEAAARPSIAGEKRDDGVVETVDTTFQDGLLENMNKGSKASEAVIVPPSEIAENSNETDKVDQKPLNSSVKTTEEVGESLEEGVLAETNLEKQTLLETMDKVAMNDNLPTSKNRGLREIEGVEEKKKTIANNDLSPDALKQKAQEEKKKQQEKNQPKQAVNKRASEAAQQGFRSQAKATVQEGSISRNSKIASRNVKSTPVGKYMAQVSKLVEKEWQRRINMHADLIQPGTLRISFLVNEKGKVFNRNILNKSFGSEIQESLTFQAVISAEIPPMPKEVRKLQGGDPIEFRYFFSFN